MIRTKLPKNYSNNHCVVKRVDDPTLGDLLSTVRREMIGVYQSYLSSADWALLRMNVIARDKECQDCGRPYAPSVGFAIHHTSYEHWGKGNYEEMWDTELLCSKCHRSADHSHAPFWAKWEADYIYLSKSRISRLAQGEGLYDFLDDNSKLANLMT